jgi:hypothetical protein
MQTTIRHLKVFTAVKKSNMIFNGYLLKYLRKQFYNKL